MNAKTISCLVTGLMISVAAPAAVPREAATVTSKAGGVETLDVESGRLVGQAVQRLILNNGYRITYEDPRYSNDDDLEDITEQVTGKPATSDKSRFVVPKSRKMSVNLATSMGAEAKLNQVVTAAAAVNPGARFRVQKDGNMYHVLPTGVRDKNGNMASQGSLLDTRITLAEESRTAHETLRAICAALTSASGEKVMLGLHGYFPYEGELTYSIAANEEPARAVLKRTLDAIAVERGPNTWILMYGNKRTEDLYALSVLQVPDLAAAKPRTLQEVPAAAPPKRSNATQDPTSVPRPR